MGCTNITKIYKFIKVKMAMKHTEQSPCTKQALSKSAMRGTAILITVSLTFILLTGPISIYYSLVTNSTDLIIYVTLHMSKNFE